MADIKLLIPGTGGITLMDQSGKDLGYPVRMKLGVKTGKLTGYSSKKLFKLLGMEHTKGQRAPRKTSLLEGVSIRPGKPIKAAYNKIPSNFNSFPYDWRADMLYNAGRLLNFIQERKPVKGRWHLVGHSQGGLLIILASKLLDDPGEFRKYVASVSLVGAPLTGTINSAYALLKGDQFGEKHAGEFVKTIRTWPALYQMMPSWKAVVDKKGEALPAQLQLTSLKCWKGHAGISSDFLQRTREVHRLLKKPLDHMDGNIRVLIIMAKNRSTKLDLIRTEKRLLSRGFKEGPGDTLVPSDLTFRRIGDLARSCVFMKPDKTIAVHSMLCSDIDIIQDVKDAIKH